MPLGSVACLSFWNATLRQEKLESRMACLWVGGGGGWRDLWHVVVVHPFNPRVQKAL